MRLCKVQVADGTVRLGVVEHDHVRFFDLESYVGIRSLSDILHAEQPAALVHDLLGEDTEGRPLRDLTMLPPVDHQEVWAAGVTYKRSQEARERESAGAARFYDLVYSAARPELFFKAPAYRVVGPGSRVRIRRDSRWSVPEPELALVISPKLHIIGYTIGNDMSSRDIEGENPLYLPQAKIYNQSCAIGPVITLAESMPPLSQVSIRMSIERNGQKAFAGTTSLDAMKRTAVELVDWLGKEMNFPNGAILLTGTGVVPPDEFTLQAGDVVTIDVTGIGQLVNVVEQG